MRRKDYYWILGVPRDADAELLRSAYRRRIKEVHPDLAQSPNAEPVRDVIEAYRVLSDPDERRRHDRELRAEAASPRVVRRDDRERWEVPVEPLRATSEPPYRRPLRTSDFSDIERLFAEVDAIFDILFRR